jgi:hypothetical protein
MEDKKRDHGGRNAAALIVSVAFILGCSSDSSVIDPYETTGGDRGREPAYIRNSINTEGRMSRAGYSSRRIDFERCS